MRFASLRKESVDEAMPCKRSGVGQVCAGWTAVGDCCLVDETSDEAASARGDEMGAFMMGLRGPLSHSNPGRVGGKKKKIQRWSGAGVQETTSDSSVCVVGRYNRG